LATGFEDGDAEDLKEGFTVGVLVDFAMDFDIGFLVVVG